MSSPRWKLHGPVNKWDARSIRIRIAGADPAISDGEKIAAPAWSFSTAIVCASGLVTSARTDGTADPATASRTMALQKQAFMKSPPDDFGHMRYG